MTVLDILTRLRVNHTEDSPRVSSGWVGIYECPFCGKKDYHIAISTETGAFKCWVCGQSGWIKWLLMRLGCNADDVEYCTNKFESSKFDASRKGKPRPKKDIQKIVVRYPGKDIVPLMHVNRACAYLTKRKIVKGENPMVEMLELVEKYNVGVGIGGMWDNRITVPIEELIKGEEGELLAAERGYNGRSIWETESKKYLMTAGSPKSQCFIGLSYLLEALNKIKEHESIVIPIVEGSFDVLSLAFYDKDAHTAKRLDEYNYSCPLGIMGKTITSAQLEDILYLVKCFEDVCERVLIAIILDRDADKQAKYIQKQLQTYLPKNQVVRVLCPKDYPDPNQYLIEKGEYPLNTLYLLLIDHSV